MDAWVHASSSHHAFIRLSPSLCLSPPAWGVAGHSQCALGVCMRGRVASWRRWRTMGMWSRGRPRQPVCPAWYGQRAAPLPPPAPSVSVRARRAHATSFIEFRTCYRLCLRVCICMEMCVGRGSGIWRNASPTITPPKRLIILCVWLVGVGACAVATTTGQVYVASTAIHAATSAGFQRVPALHNVTKVHHPPTQPCTHAHTTCTSPLYPAEQ
jgi:hypothetical protein